MNNTNVIDLVADESEETLDSSIYSSNESDTTIGLRPITKGCIVKGKCVDLFDEWTARRNNIKWIYGVADGIADRCEETGKIGWYVKWNLLCYAIDTDMPYAIVEQHEDDLVLVKNRDDGRDESDVFEIKKYFEKMTSGNWHRKDPFVFKCEFCGGAECDRVEFREELQDDLEDKLHFDGDPDDFPHNEMRKAMYRDHIYTKHGVLGHGVRIQPAACVLAFIRQRIPTPSGVENVGFHEA